MRQVVESCQYLVLFDGVNVLTCRVLRYKMYLINKYNEYIEYSNYIKHKTKVYERYTTRYDMEIIISSNANKPIYEQITSQIKAMIMSGELQTGDSIPSMRSLAKTIHVSVITVQKAYEDLARDGFIETTVGRGSFVAAQNKEFIREEQQKQIEEYLVKAVDIAKSNGIKLEKLTELLSIFYLDEGEE